MDGDQSRVTFDRASHHSAVLLQQGRIVTDADWNEQADLTRYRAELQARDTIGTCGAPMDAAGFALVAETNAFAVHVVDANEAWVAAEDGVLLHTSDAGAHWKLIDLRTTAHLRALQLAGNVGWVVGDGGVVRHTSDQGQSWTTQNAGTVHALRGVAVLDANHAWAVGDGGIVVATSDGGVNWSLVQTDAARLHAVHFVNILVGLAVGQGGAIVGTSNGGDTWIAAASGTTAHLLALAVFPITSSATLAWAAGQGGTIVRSDDFGATWLPCNTPSDATLYAIGFRNEHEGWAVGDGGVVLHSTDGGANWARKDFGTSAMLRGVSFFNGDPGWVVGEASTALRLAGSSAVAHVGLPAVNLSIEPGRYYVDGTLCELEARASYAHQPDGGALERLAPGAYLVYLNAWQRHLSALEMPAIREVALGGPDTATRARSVAQVRTLPLPVASPFDWNCDSTIGSWDALVHAPRPRLAARAEPQLAAVNICEIAATAGYRRLENQLYRVEVHEGGAHPTFKWSRENGSVGYSVVSVSVKAAQQQTVVRVAARGRDANLDLAVHDRVELVDDDAERIHRAGVLFEYLHDGEDELELVLAGVPAGSLGQDPSLHPILRRWDHQPAVAGRHVLPIIENTWIDLEDGVQVRFTPGGIYRPGDYWQIPARTITGDVEWPRDDNGDPIPREPAGVADVYCRLGIVEVSADHVVTVVSDCRELFPPLTSLEQLLYGSGDGQDAAPGELLPQPLEVRVARGSVPVAGAHVRFEVENGGGRIGAGRGGSPWQFETATDGDGHAFCHWTLGPAAAAPARFQRVRASLLDVDSRALPGQTVVFCASASLWLQYVSGDGQQAPPGAPVPHPLEVRVANGTDGVEGAMLRYTVEQGGGSVVGPTIVATDAHGLASIGWQLGTSGLQRLRAELIDSDGQVLQRQSFNASAVVPATARGGCDITIGAGGDHEKLDSGLLRSLLEQGGGAACICFLPGNHDIGALQADGSERFRLTLHGCGHTSLLIVGDTMLRLGGFASLELCDLVIQAQGEVGGVLLEKNAETRLSAVQIDRSRDQARTPCLRIAGAQRVSMTGCEVTAATPTTLAVVFEDVTGDCQVEHNRFVGIVSFYGDPAVPTIPLLRGLFDRAREARLASVPAQLKFCNNNTSLLAIGAAVTGSLSAAAPAQPAASGLFETATIAGNTITEPLNLLVAGRMIAVSGNTLLAEPGADNVYGLFIAERAIAVGNLTLLPTPGSPPLMFVAQNFEKAANVAIVQP
jgi:photosystem II stability/assembly factor-like uncharacterized protein